MTINRIVLAALISIFTIGGSMAQNSPKLPQNIQTFLNTHFQGIETVKLDIDPDDRDMYEIDLADGTELEFDREGVLLKMENANGLPLIALPKGMDVYIAAQYPNLQVVEFEKESRGYDVELSNDIELKFDTAGKFVKID